ncbi:Gfo/Idh/MocA family protein [Ferrovibrio sp.]|uniref:Gfo/Idh/MocA family protein n=1 Tax=Ferrovibrio sp. TaxID=1917215 RepID=UPI0035B124E5
MAERFRVVVVGMGVQGEKRVAAGGKDVVATIDPYKAGVTHKHIEEMPLDAYDAALICTPDEPKIEILSYLARHGKHALVEKPLLSHDTPALQALSDLVKASGVVCYTAYNHRFEPHFIRMREAIQSGRLGRIYSLRMFYGNGTARLVRDSMWRDQGDGVLPDLGSHLLDTAAFWFGDLAGSAFQLFSANRFENRAWDHIAFGRKGDPLLQFEMTLLSWRNHFYADVFAENGSAHIQSLCKWGPSTFTIRDRKLPSGRPDEDLVTLVCADPTWAAEYAHFKALCAAPGNAAQDLAKDIWINATLLDIAAQAKAGAA